jgi:hypothetical protein
MSTAVQLDLFAAATERWVDAHLPHERRERALHIHSLDAVDAKAEVLTGRKAEIVAWLRQYGPATDRQVRDALFSDRGDMNMVRPRITELVKIGVCHEVGSVVDDTTGLHVRIVRAKMEGEL